MTLAEYEALSYAEQTHLIGEKVMGWKHVSWHGQYQWDAGGTVGGFPACTDFHPLTSDADACAVVRQINEQPGYAMMLFYAHQSNANSVLVWDLGAAPFGAGAVFHHVSEYLKTEPEVHASLREKFGQQCFDAVVESGPDMPAIICLAALRAVGAVE